ncbi:MAG: peptidylprolyl isomerase [Campylobacterota bacterium]|nr:peptidylprolyl isomerase [Campylobacterota bacterium]
MKQSRIISFGQKTVLSIVTSLVLASSSYAVDNKVYAVVNGDNITSNDISLIIRDPRVQFKTLPENTQKDIINKLIEQKLLSQDMLKSDIVKTKEYKDSLKMVKQNLALQVWMQREHKNIKISDKEVEKFYKSNQSKFKQPEQFKANHILVKTQKEAKDIIKSLSSSKKLKEDFIKAAKAKSTGPSGVNGGDLGWFTKDKMVPEFSNATAKLSKDSITKEPVKTQFGFHIIYLDDKKDPITVALKSVKNKIIENLKQENLINKLKTKAAQLKKSAKIEYK